jgi:protein-S-isoprenylcysteine O-methyltransferase Ste14
LVFAVFISDLRKKDTFIPLVSERLTLILKICYLIPIGIYIYIIANLDWISPVDLVALSLTSIGTFFATKAKIDIEEHHTWTGYYLEKTTLVTKGIFAYVRHPLYTGIFVFIIGALLTSTFHSPFLTAVALPSLVYILSFLTIMAMRETRLLTRQFGDEFLKYKKKVHPFLPFRKRIEPENLD